MACPAVSATSQSIGWWNVREAIPSGPGAGTCCAGDGSTDDTAALQHWINYATGAQGTPVIYLPPGYYKITSSITITSPCEILGLGNTSTDQSENGTQIVVAPASGALIFDAFQVSGTSVAVRGITIVNLTSGVNANDSSGYGINLVKNNQGVQITDVRIVNMANGVNISGSGAVLCSNVSFIPYDAATTAGNRVGFRATGISPGNANACSLLACTVDESGNENHVTTAFAIEDGYNTMILIDCIANGAFTGYHSNLTTGSAPNIFQVVQCAAIECTWGVLLDYGEVTIIESCTIANTVFRGAGGIGIQISPTFVSGALVAISNCIVNTTDYAGVYINDGGAVVTLSGGTIANVGQSGTPSVGLRIQQGSTNSSLSVSGLTINGTEKAGVYISAGHLGMATLTGVTQTNGGAGYGLQIDSTVAGVYNVTGCSFNPSSSIAGSGSSSPYRKLSNNVGLNPVGALSVAAPSSSYTLNSFGVDVSVYVHGSSTTTPKLQSPTGAITTLEPTSGLVRVPAGYSILLSPFSGFSWTWFGD